MARIRSVKPEYWDDRKLAKRTSRDARLLYIALWNHADEHCRLQGDPQWIKGQAFPFDDDLDAAAIGRLLKELESVGAVIPYEADEDPYLFLPKLAKHQRLEPEKVKSRLPPPPSESCADSSERGAYESGSHADVSEPGADSSALLYVAGGREQVAGGRGTRVTPTPLGSALLDEHLAQYKHKPPRDVIRVTGEKIDSLLDEGTDTEDIKAGLAKLRSRPDLGGGVLPSLVNEIVQTRGNGGRPPPKRGAHQPYQNPPDDSAYEKDL